MGERIRADSYRYLLRTGRSRLKIAITIAFLGLALATATSSAAAVDEFTAGFLSSACKALLDCEAKPAQPWCDVHAPANQTVFRGIGFCHGFIIASMSGHVFALFAHRARWRGTGDVGDEAFATCVKSLEKNSVGDFIHAFVDYVDAHPETRAQEAFSVATQAFQTKFPCR